MAGESKLFQVLSGLLSNDQKIKNVIVTGAYSNAKTLDARLSTNETYINNIDKELSNLYEEVLPFNGSIVAGKDIGNENDPNPESPGPDGPGAGDDGPMDLP